MKYSMIAALLLVVGCNKPVVPEAEAAVETTEVKAETLVSEAPTPAPEVKAEPEPEAKPEPPPKPKKNLGERGCRKLLYQFDQCGWRCSHRGGSPGRCVSACRPLIDSRTKLKCLQLWGPGFG